MKRSSTIIYTLLLSASLARAADAPATRPWQSLTNPTSVEIAAHFDKPPTQNASHDLGLGRQRHPRRHHADLDSAHARGINTVALSPAKSPTPPISRRIF